ncbi:MAG: hypothetical protein ING66_08555 [Rhodocyclaceae bacterium]|nr:hypothetical protein [Rhodocyclaceae bacterium]MCA3081620.1 hypothetical protein [Rhodocyclaceae bacterium]
MKFNTIVLGAATLMASTVLFAGGDHKPQYGGVVLEVNEVQYELVAKPNTIAIYVDDHGKKVDATGATAKVTMLNGKEKTEATLTPAGGNKLEAKGAFVVKAGTKVVAVVTMAGKPGMTMRFVLP